MVTSHTCGEQKFESFLKWASGLGFRDSGCSVQVVKVTGLGVENLDFSGYAISFRSNSVLWEACMDYEELSTIVLFGGLRHGTMVLCGVAAIMVAFGDVRAFPIRSQLFETTMSRTGLTTL